MSPLRASIVIALALGFSTGARADEGPPDIALPELGNTQEPDKTGTKQGPAIPTIEPGDIDIANIVTSAAKGVTTVQEAPSIITIITAEEIRARGFKTIGQVLATVPGWLDIQAEGDQVELPMVRGQVQAALFLRDGLSFFEPVLNVATLSRALPLENVKRIEVLTGPGGVLWGANSYLGVVNVITKDADDLNGVELSAGYGDGRGDPTDIRAYAMFGKSFWNGKFKLFLHASYENYKDPEYTRQAFYATSPSPQPIGPAIYGTNTITSDVDRSWLLNLDGKMSIGPITFYGAYPLGHMFHSLEFSAGPIVKESCPMGTSGCLNYPGAADQWDFYDRYGMVEYKDRFFHDKVGINVKGYYINFVRDLAPRVFISSGALPGGLQFQVTDLTIQRYGGTFDGDFSGPFSWSRILFGGEAFNESVSTSYSHFQAPIDPMTGMTDPSRLPIVCPIDSTGKYAQDCKLVFVNGAERTVIGLFLDLQLRPLPTLTFDGGIRYQQGFGKRGYASQFLGSAAAVWQFAPNYHLKLNFSQGFRPPVFNDTDSNGYGVQFGGNPNLQVEQSQAYQAEVNARLLKGVRRIRELQLRLDYSYTLLDHAIVLQSGQYTNAGRRGIHSVELFGKLYLAGDHAVTFGYSFLDVSTSDKGQLRSVPNHWASLGMVFNLIKDTLDVNGNLNLFGAYEDPNRIQSGSYTIPPNMPGTIAPASDLSFDRLTPVAQLQLGARLRLWREHITASIQFYNVLNQHYFYPDAFYDFAPTVELHPTQAPGFSFFGSITYRQ